MPNTQKHLSWTKQDWINKAKVSDAGFIHCFIPSISISFMHNFHDLADKYGSMKTFIKQNGLDNLHVHFESIGLSVLYSTVDTIHAINHVSIDSDSEPCLEQQFLDKKRNIFIINIEDHAYLDKTLTYVVEYKDTDKPLADYTVDYDDVAERDRQRNEVKNMFARIRRNKTNNNNSSFDDFISDLEGK